MISKISVLVGSLAVFCSSAMAQFGGPVFPADTPYFYNPESSFTLVTFNGGGSFDFDCGVDWVSQSTGYTMRLPDDMDRMMQIPYHLEAQGIDTICDGSFEGGSGNSISISTPPNMDSNYDFGPDGYGNHRTLQLIWVERDDMVTTLEEVFQESPPLTNTEFQNTFGDPADCLLYPESSTTSNFILETCDENWSCYLLNQQNVTFLDLCGVPSKEGPPVGWDQVAAHASTAFDPRTLPAEFVEIFERHEDRMMAIYHNFWVQNNDPNTIYFVAQQNRLYFTRLAYDLLIDELEAEYAVWLAAQP